MPNKVILLSKQAEEIKEVLRELVDKDFGPMNYVLSDLKTRAKRGIIHIKTGEWR